MPLLLFLILVILIAQFGFWDTLEGILGGILMIVMVVLLFVAALVLTVHLLWWRRR